jgi:hypothetical protein
LPCRFWVSLDDVRTQTTCEHCGQDFKVTPQLRDRDWRYRRSGLFGRDNYQEGEIPVALTLLQIQTSLHLHDMLCTTALEIEPAGAPVQKCESDFVIITQQHTNHKVQITIGECKNRGEITEDDVAKLRMVAEADMANTTHTVFYALRRKAPQQPHGDAATSLAEDGGARPQL